jgi:hypothetical protein
MQSACTVLYCHLWPVWLYHIFPHYLINGTIFGKKLLNIKCVFWFSVQRLSEIFLILRINQRDTRDSKPPRDVDDICALLGYYAALCGGSVPTFREIPSVPYSRVKKSNDIIINIHRSSCNVALFLSGFHGTWNFWANFRKIFKYQIL